MKRLLAVIVLLLTLATTARAQYAIIDTSACLPSKAYRFNAKQLIAPSALIVAGSVVHFAAHDQIEVPVRDFMNDWKGGTAKLMRFDDYIQYLPIVMDLGMSALNVPAENPFVDRVIEAALTYVTLGVTSGLMKQFIYSPRPNQVDAKSFPSGHVDLAFAGAELVRMEYGNAWGAGAYAIATTVAVMRLYRDWQWLGDVVAGAGLGILCAHVGGYLLEPVKNLFGLKTVIVPVLDPVSRTVCTGVSITF